METWTIPPDPYAALGLERDCSPQTIKARYYQLARRYHPNRHYATDEAKHALAGHFHRIHEAWLLLNRPEQRRRYLDLIELAELQDEVLHKHREITAWERDESSSEEWASSDAEDYDLTHLSAIRRARSPMGDFTSDVEDNDRATANAEANDHHSHGAPKPKPRGREPDRRGTHPPVQKPRTRHEREGSDAQAAAKRRRKLEKYKRRELKAFHEYKDAMLVKLDAEFEAERLRTQYEEAKWKREKAESAPREASTRVRLAQQINRAVMLFKTQATPKLQRRPTLNISKHILSAGENSRDGDFLTVNSPSATRHLGSHWRGWSSDISGDQTSSEDDGYTSAAVRRSGRSPSTISRRRKAPDPKLLPPRTISAPNTVHQLINGDQEDDLHPPPFRMLIKRPTGLGSPLGSAVQDSSDGSASPLSGSSRSPSPHISGHSRDLVMFSQEQHDLALASKPHHNRTMSAPGSGHIRHGSDPDLDIAVSGVPESMFAVKVIGDLRFKSTIPRDHVHRLKQADENWLLKPPSDEDANPELLLHKLQHLDPAVAKRFMVKKDIKASFAFRLICSSRHFVRQQHSSFIALSYRRKLVVEKHKDYYTLPLEKEMLQAVWEERISENEGLWIDQICIDQDSDVEKTISMSAMDLVYRSARVIIVALDDLELKEHEGTVLQNHVLEYERLKHVVADKRFRRHQPPYLETHEDLLQVLQKILSSSWFRRAWCRHEMRLARDHIFLLPCRTVGSFKRTVLRLTSSCIAHLLALATEVPFDAQIELLKPALYAFFRDRTQPSAAGATNGLHHGMGNFTTVVAEVFGMEAGGDPRLPIEQREADARRDKVSIILNTMECGLALRHAPGSSRISMSKEDCYYSLLLLALAAGDPGALCSVGKPMLQIAAPESMRLTKPAVSSWLFEPTNVDAGLNNYKTLDRLPANSKLSTGISHHGSHYVQLDLHMLSRERLHRASDNPEILSLAQSFVYACETRKLGRHRKRYLLHDGQANTFFGNMRDVYSETLACVFACGPDWMTEVCIRHGVSRYKLDLQPACWLMVALRNMNGKWPKADWVDRAAGFTMDFVNFLVIRGMPQRQLRAGQSEAWRPSVVTTPNMGKLLMFRPPGLQVSAAVPSVLLDIDYVHLARLWMLVPRKNSSQWTLRGKSVMFGDDAGISHVNCDGDEGQVVLRQHRIYGREADELAG
jgi:curved DNA-binding protein CbpA